MLKTPVGVSRPGRPVETVVAPIGTPLRYRTARWLLRFTMSSIGPSGAIAGAQMYSPGLSFATISTTEPELASTCCAFETPTGAHANANARVRQRSFILPTIGRAFGRA